MCGSGKEVKVEGCRKRFEDDQRHMNVQREAEQDFRFRKKSTVGGLSDSTWPWTLSILSSSLGTLRNHCSEHRFLFGL